jgi:hypothetical protein
MLPLELTLKFFFLYNTKVPSEFNEHDTFNNVWLAQFGQYSLSKILQIL